MRASRLRPGDGGRLASAIALLLCLGPALLPAQQTTQELRSIHFAGAQAFPDVLLRAAILSNASGCKNVVLDVIQACRLGVGRDPAPADTLDLQGDVFRLISFYKDRGYREARVKLETRTEANLLHATFRITEGDPVRVVTVGLSNLEQADSASQLQLRRMVGRLPLRAGDPLSKVAYQAARDTLTTRLQNLGYKNAEVFPRYRIPRDSARVAHMVFDLIPGGRMYFGAPDVRGNEKVETRVIRRMLAFRAGDVYSQEAILRSQRNLFGLDMFRTIDIRTDIDAAGDTIAPLVTVQEGPLTRVRTGLGVSTAEYINAEARWISRNFLGGARRVEVRGRVANVLANVLDNTFASLSLVEKASSLYNNLDYLFSVDVTQPWFFDLRNSFSGGLVGERRSIPDVFVRRSLGGYAGVTRALGPGTTLSAGYRLELTELDAEDDIFCTSFVACEASEISILREAHWLAPLTVTLARDRSNSLFDPTRGSILRIEGEYAASASGSEFGYARLAAEGTMYREPFRGLVLATRLRPGWARSINEPGVGLGLHPQKRFFAGGANSVRGFAQYRLGPKILKVDAHEFLLAPAPDTITGFMGCDAQDINAGTCEVALLAVGRPGRFDPRPAGGSAALEGNVEARFRLVGEKLRGAAFVDFGQVWTDGGQVRLSDVLWTPGFGLRYFSAIGPIRIDLGYNTQGTERLQVLTTKLCDVDVVPCSPDSIEDGVVYTRDQLRNTRVLTSLGHVPWGFNRGLLDRLQLHFSIGQAF
ncbi:MAG: BamA/OMP85 family outer membrane protein [Longimicrobiales bacterium]